MHRAFSGDNLNKVQAPATAFVPAVRLFAGVLFVLLLTGIWPHSGQTKDLTSEEVPTILVLPIKATGSLSDLGFALSLRILGVLRATGGTNLVHPKMTERVVERYDHRFAPMLPHDRRATMAAVLGASHVLHGVLNRAENKLILRIEPIQHKGPKAHLVVEAKNLQDLLDSLAPHVLKVAHKAQLLRQYGPPKQFEVAPSTRYRQAMLDHAACHRALLRQPLGISQPIVIDESAIRLAMDFCVAALERDPEFESAKADLALAHAYLGERREAELLLTSLKDSPAILPMYWLARFWILSRYYDVRFALENLEEAVTQHPGFMLARGYLGEAHLALGKPLEALNVFRVYLKRCPRQSYVMGQIGRSTARAGHAQEAIEWTLKALKKTPRDPELSIQLAHRRLEAKEYGSAINTYIRVIEEGGARSEVHLRLGEAYLKVGELSKAEQHIRQALAKSLGATGWKTRGEARYALALLWLKADSPRNAIRHLRQALLEGYLDVEALESPQMSAIRTHRDFRLLRQTQPRPGAAPTYVSPLGRVTASAQLEPPHRFERRQDRKVMERL